MLAGTDTSSSVMQMICIYLSQNPEIEKKVRKVIDLVIRTDEDITYENLKKMEYLEWIIH